MASSPPIRWSDLAEASVGVWGVGVEGRATLRKLDSLGIEPVAVVDDDPRPGAGITVVATREGGLDQLARCDVVLKTPGISRYRSDFKELEHRGVAVVGGLGLWMEETDRDHVLLVTGTKGKSTTVSVLGHLLRGLGHPTFVGGNLGTVPYDPQADIAGTKWWVIEASSFQVLDLWSAPSVVAVTSLSPDHLDWHGGSVDRYFADKLSVCTLPGADVVIANGADAELLARVHLLGPRVRWTTSPKSQQSDWTNSLGLLGAHNRGNALIARDCLIEAGVVTSHDSRALEVAAAGFEPLPSRLQIVARMGNVEFVDDSLSTNVLPTIAALKAFPERRLALLVGGFDRGIDYGPLAQFVRSRLSPTLVVTLPDNGPRVGAALRSEPLPDQVRVVASTDLAGGVRIGFEWCHPNGVVLLSPAAPSFGRFTDYKERSAVFLQAVEECREGG